MPSEVMNSLIAVSGVLIAAIVSYLTGTRRAKIEIQKFKAEARKAFGSKLYEKRLKIYPELYSYLSDYVKILKYGEITKNNVTDIFTKLQTWDSKNAIFFGGYTHNVCSELRHYFGSLSKKTDEELKNLFNSEESKTELKQKLQNVELSLKYELGTFDFETPLDEQEVKFFKTYYDAHLYAANKLAKQK